MKYISIALLFLFAVHSAYGYYPPQKQKVYSIVKQYQSVAWYEEQLKLWENETKSNPKNAEAWMNVYTATRMLKLMNASKTKQDMDAIVEKVQQNIPETFEGTYIPYWNGNKEEQMLLKAYAMDSNRPETYSALVTLYELNRDRGKLIHACVQWLLSNDISKNMYTWNYNMLASCEPNAILITQGDNDTYPAWVLQNAKGIRTDVAVLNIFLLHEKKYRDARFKELGLPAFQLPDGLDDKATNQAICAHMQKYSTRPFYYANTVAQDNYDNVKNDLYTVGLAFKYSKTSFDNIAVLRKNYEKNFLKDYLKASLDNDISQGVVDYMNSNYLTPFLVLYKHYYTTDYVAELNTLKRLITSIAEKVGQTDEVNAILNQGKQ